MKILVTGANGLLGQKLSKVLLNDPDVTAILTARGALTFEANNALFTPMDIADTAQVASRLMSHKPDVVINTAAMTMVDDCETRQEDCWKANVTSVENLVDACNDNGCHLVHVSTDFIFEGDKGPLDETATPNPVNFYGKSKLAAEEIIIARAKSWAILRTVLVFGITNDLSRSNIVVWVKQSLENKKPIKVVNDQWRTPTLAEDLAMGCYFAAKQKAKGIYNISGKDFMTPYDIAVATADYFGLDKSLITPTDSTQFKQPARRPLKTGFIIDKARKDLGYEPRSFREGLAIVADQMKGKAVTA